MTMEMPILILSKRTRNSRFVSLATFSIGGYRIGGSCDSVARLN